MAKIRVRLAEKDRAERERGGDWFEVDSQLSELDDLSWDELDLVERGTNSTALMLAQVERRALTARYLRVLLWLARRGGGVVEDFAGFKPAVTFHGRGDPDVIAAAADDDDAEPAPAGDADPPEGTPPASAGSGESAKLSTPSTRRSPGSTTSRPAKSAP